MVLLAGLAAVNQQEEDEWLNQEATLEAQEAAIVSRYEHALRGLQNGDAEGAQAAFQWVLAEPLVATAANEQLQRIKFLSLKHLAGLLAVQQTHPAPAPTLALPDAAAEAAGLDAAAIVAAEAAGRAQQLQAQQARQEEALRLYWEASEVDSTDVVLWSKLGTLAAQLGCWAAAKHAFEQGLHCDPQHPTLPDKLLQLLLHLGDYDAAAGFAAAMLRQRPHHPSALAVLRQQQQQQQQQGGMSPGSWSAPVAVSGGLLRLPPAGPPAADTPQPHPPQPQQVQGRRDAFRERPFPDAATRSIPLTQLTWQSVLQESLKFLLSSTASLGGTAKAGGAAAAEGPAGPGQYKYYGYLRLRQPVVHKAPQLASAASPAAAGAALAAGAAPAAAPGAAVAGGLSAAEGQGSPAPSPGPSPAPSPVLWPGQAQAARLQDNSPSPAPAAAPPEGSKPGSSGAHSPAAGAEPGAAAAGGAAAPAAGREHTPGPAPAAQAQHGLPSPAGPPAACQAAEAPAEAAAETAAATPTAAGMMDVDTAGQSSPALTGGGGGTAESAAAAGGGGGGGGAAGGGQEPVGVILSPAMPTAGGSTAQVPSHHDHHHQQQQRGVEEGPQGSRDTPGQDAGHQQKEEVTEPATEARATRSRVRGTRSKPAAADAAATRSSSGQHLQAGEQEAEAAWELLLTAGPLVAAGRSFVPGANDSSSQRQQQQQQQGQQGQAEAAAAALPADAGTTAAATNASPACAAAGRSSEQAAADEAAAVSAFLQRMPSKGLPRQQLAATLLRQLLQPPGTEAVPLPPHAAVLPLLLRLARLAAAEQGSHTCSRGSLLPQHCLALAELHADAAAAAARAAQGSAAGGATGPGLSAPPAGTSLGPSRQAQGGAAAAGAAPPSGRSRGVFSALQQQLSVAECCEGGVLWLMRYRTAVLQQQVPLPRLPAAGRTAAARALQPAGNEPMQVDQPEQQQAQQQQHEQQQSQQEPGPADDSWSSDSTISDTGEGGTEDSSHGSAEGVMRYWWALGRLQESRGDAPAAAAAYTNCLAALVEAGVEQPLQLPHCRSDAVISPAAVSAKLELLRLHGLLVQAAATAQQGEHAVVVSTLAPALLSCDDKEQQLLQLDRALWLQGLQLLLAAAAVTAAPAAGQQGPQNGDGGRAGGDSWLLGLRCHLRLLSALLPKVPVALTGLLAGEEAQGQQAQAEAAAALKAVAAALAGAPEAAAALEAAAAFLSGHAALLRGERQQQQKQHPQGNAVEGQQQPQRLQSDERGADAGISAGPQPLRLHPFEWQCFTEVQQQLLVAVQACSSAAAAAAGASESRLNTKVHSWRQVACDAATCSLQFFCTPQPPAGALAAAQPQAAAAGGHGPSAAAGQGAAAAPLTSAAPRPAAAAELLWALCEALGQGGALVERNGDFVRACLSELQRQLGRVEQQLQQQVEAATQANSHAQAGAGGEERMADMPVQAQATAAGQAGGAEAMAGEAEAGPSDEHGGEEGKEGDELTLEETKDFLQSGVQHCLLWLYGIDLPGRQQQEEWGAGLQADAAIQQQWRLRVLESRDAVAEVWPLVAPHMLAEAQAGTRHMAKYRGFLEAVAVLFPGAPAAVARRCAATWQAAEEQEPPPVTAALRSGGPVPDNPMLSLLASAEEEAAQAAAAEASSQGEAEAMAMDDEGGRPGAGAAAAATRNAIGAAAPAAAGSRVAEEEQHEERQQQRELQDRPPGSWSAVEELRDLQDLHQRYRPILSSLFYLQTAAQPDLHEALAGRLLADDAEQALEAYLAPTKADLCYNPERFSLGWEHLAACYHKAADMLLEAGCSALVPGELEQRPPLLARLARWRRLGHLCCGVALSLTGQEGDRSYLLMLAGQRLLADVQNAPPLYDQQGRVPHKSSPHYQQQVAAAAAAFQAAAEVLPDEWELQLLLAKCSRKAGAAPAEWLPLLALACRLAVQHAGGLVEPVYALHAARLKLLLNSVKQRRLAAKQQQEEEEAEERQRQQQQEADQQQEQQRQQVGPAGQEEDNAAAGMETDQADDAEPAASWQQQEQALLELLCRHCFLPETQQATAPLLAGLSQALHAAEGQLGELSCEEGGRRSLRYRRQLVQAVLADCVAAMQWILVREKHYHKAARRLAQALYSQEGATEAAAALAPLFTPAGRSSRQALSFSIHMFAIEAKIDEGQAAWGAQARRGRRKRAGRGAATADDVATEGAAAAATNAAAGAGGGGSDGSAAAVGHRLEGVPESDWGLQPARVAGVGVNESLPAFYARVRRCLRFYLDLLVESGGVEALAAAANFFASGSPGGWQLACLSDLEPLARGLSFVGLASALQAVLPYEQLATSEEGGEEQQQQQQQQGVHAPQLPSMQQSQRLQHAGQPPRARSQPAEAPPPGAAAAAAEGAGAAAEGPSPAAAQPTPAAARQPQSPGKHSRSVAWQMFRRAAAFDPADAGGGSPAAGSPTAGQGSAGPGSPTAGTAGTAGRSALAPGSPTAGRSGPAPTSPTAGQAGPDPGSAIAASPPPVTVPRASAAAAAEPPSAAPPTAATLAFTPAVTTAPLTGQSLPPPASGQSMQGTPAPLGQQQQQHLRRLASRLDAAVAEPLLQRAYRLYQEHVLLDSSGHEWSSRVVAPARQALHKSRHTRFGKDPRMHDLLAGSAILFRSYAELYVQLLRELRAGDKLLALLKPLKQRYKVQRLTLNRSAKGHMQAVGQAAVDVLAQGLQEAEQQLAAAHPRLAAALQAAASAAAQQTPLPEPPTLARAALPGPAAAAAATAAAVEQRWGPSLLATVAAAMDGAQPQQQGQAQQHGEEGASPGRLQHLTQAALELQRKHDSLSAEAAAELAPAALEANQRAAAAVAAARELERLPPMQMAAGLSRAQALRRQAQQAKDRHEAELAAALAHTQQQKQQQSPGTAAAGGAAPHATVTPGPAAAVPMAVDRAESGFATPGAAAAAGAERLPSAADQQQVEEAAGLVRSARALHKEVLQGPGGGRAAKGPLTPSATGLKDLGSQAEELLFRAYRLHAALSTGAVPAPSGREATLKAVNDLCRQQRRGSKPPAAAAADAAGAGEREAQQPGLPAIPETEQQKPQQQQQQRGRKRGPGDAGLDEGGDAASAAVVAGSTAAPAAGEPPRTTRKRLREAAEEAAAGQQQGVVQAREDAAAAQQQEDMPAGEAANDEAGQALQQDQQQEEEQAVAAAAAQVQQRADEDAEQEEQKQHADAERGAGEAADGSPGADADRPAAEDAT